MPPDYTVMPQEISKGSRLIGYPATLISPRAQEVKAIN
jgi:hypothetical protein